MSRHAGLAAILLAALALLIPYPAASIAPVAATPIPQSKFEAVGSGGGPWLSGQDTEAAAAPFQPRTLSPAPSPAPATLAPSARAVPRLASVAVPAPPSVDRTVGSAMSATGIASWFRSPAGVSAAGPELRAALGPGWRGSVVTVTGPAGSAVVTLGDWMRADRLIDLDAPVFVRVCGALSVGLCRVEVTW